MILNITKKIPLARNSRHALGFLERGRGMIGRSFDSFDAMVFEDCDAIHTMFMSSSIDVLFVASDNRICRAVASLKPWRPLIRCPGARAVIELPAGTIGRTGTEAGDYVDLCAELTEERRKALSKDKDLLAATIAPMKELK